MTTKFWRRGEPFVWATGGTLAIIVSMTALLMFVVIANGIGVFWPKRLAQLTLNDGSHTLGEIIRQEMDPSNQPRLQLKIGNRELNGLDFTWISESDIRSQSYPKAVYAIERQEYGDFYGTLKEVHSPGRTVTEKGGGLDQALAQARRQVQPLLDAKKQLNARFSALNSIIDGIEQKIARYRYKHIPDQDERIVALKQQVASHKAQFAGLVDEGQRNTEQLAAYYALFRTADAKESKILIGNMVRPYQPNRMSLVQKIGHYAAKLKELFLDDPRESNTEGGVFPAIFGTVMMVLIMSVAVVPFGVLAALYLREYAHQGVLVRVVRIAVNNLAGVPSIVFGIFGLGFFVYFLGGSLDALFFPERLPTPTFGTGGILWASLTLALLTVPVVIVATEEARARSRRRSAKGRWPSAPRGSRP